VIVGLALALACALATNVAFLFKNRGAVLAAPVRVRHPLRSAADLFRSRWFTIGWLVAITAWVLHVGALALAPLSIVQVVLSGGLVFLAVLAERYFGFQLGRRQWIGLIITAAGLAVIGLTSGSQDRDAPGYALAALIVLECAVLGLATGLALVPLVISGNKPGHEIEYPMAVVILGGLTTSTILNLFLLPPIYALFGRIQRVAE